MMHASVKISGVIFFIIVFPYIISTEAHGCMVILGVSEGAARAEMGDGR